MSFHGAFSASMQLLENVYVSPALGCRVRIALALACTYTMCLGIGSAETVTRVEGRRTQPRVAGLRQPREAGLNSKGGCTMAGSINSGYNPSAASVPVSKYIANAEQVGVAQNTGKQATQVKADPAPAPNETDTAATLTSAAPAAAPQSPADEPVPGIQQQQLPEGGVQLATDSGLSLKTTPDGKIDSIEVPGEGTIRNEGGSLSFVAPDGTNTPVQPFADEHGDLLGYQYTRKDQTQVHVNLESMSVAYASREGDVWQEVDATGAQLILTKSHFKDPATGQITEIKNQIVVSPEGEVQMEGDGKDLKVSAGKVEFRGPTNFPAKIELPNPIASLNKTEAPKEAAPAEAASTDAGAAAVAGPVLMEEPPQKPAANATLPSFMLFHRDEQGQTAIQLRSGLTLMHTKDRTMITDPKTGERIPAQVETYKAPDGRTEKMFSFNDSTGNKYKMFDDSMDFLVESPDGKVRQHVLPDGTILGQIQGDQGTYRFEVNPKGQFKTDPGLGMQPLAGRDVNQAQIMGADGKPMAVTLPYPIPVDQSNAGLYADYMGAPAYPVSGQRLDAFGPPPQQPPAQPPQAPPLPPQAQPPQAGTPPQASYVPDPRGFTAPPPPGSGTPPPLPPGYGPTYFPQAGYPQQPVQPGVMQRLKYMFTGNPMDLQPKHVQAPPAWSGGYPNTYYGAPGGAGYGAASQAVPGYGYGYGPAGDPMAYPGPGGYAPGGTPGYPNQGLQPGYGVQPGQSFGNPYGTGGPVYGPPVHGGTPSYPQQQPQPGFTGQTPGYPGQMPDANAYIAHMQQRFNQADQMMWGQLAATSAGTNMMALGQMFNSGLSSLSFGMAMMPSSYFFNPFRMW
jgi:hypothetical protein